MTGLRTVTLLLLLAAPALAACGREGGTRGAYVGGGAGAVLRTP